MIYRCQIHGTKVIHGDCPDCIRQVMNISIDPECISIDTPSEAEVYSPQVVEGKKRCPIELFVEKYFNMPPDISPNTNLVNFTYADLIGVIVAYSEQHK